MAMLENGAVAHAHLKTPRAAAIAGIVFSLLMFAIFWLLRRSIPADPLESGSCGLTLAAQVPPSISIC